MSTPITPLNIPIRDYLDQTKYITEELIRLLNKVDEDWANILHKTGAIPLYKKNVKMYDDFSKMLRADGQPEEAFDYVSRAAEHSKIASSYEEQVKATQAFYNNALIIKNSPLQSIAQALLQIGKQGISSRYGKSKKNCEQALSSVGKAMPAISIQNVSLLDVIWEGRNQSIHFEDKTFNPPTNTCFEELLKDPDLKFQQLVGYDSGENKSMEIVRILGWTDYKKFESDLLSLSV